jgi:uncharacterized membrane protein
MKERHNTLLYILTILASLAFLFVGNKIATKDLTLYQNNDFTMVTVVAKVNEVTNRSTTSEYDPDGNLIYENTEIAFNAAVTKGETKGTLLSGIQNIDSMLNRNLSEVEPGDKVLLLYNEFYEKPLWEFIEFIKIDKLYILGAFFALTLLVFGSIKGFNTMISLGFTCAGIFLVFIPSILSGKNIYISSIIICVFTTIMTFLIINGYNKKTLAASLGCIGGLFVAGSITLIMGKVLALTGYSSEESLYLTFLSPDRPLDLKAIIFAAILIGSMGAIMDVAMSISSSLQELKDQAGTSSPSDLFRSGMNIGRDIMGTMVNTLILAYIGSSLSVVLLMSAYSTSFNSLLNSEKIIVEILQALVGSFGVLFALPLTSIVCAVLYKGTVEQTQNMNP